MRKHIYRILFAFFVLVFIVSAVALIRYGIQSQENQNLYNSLAGLHTTGSSAARPSATYSSGIPSTGATEPTGSTAPWDSTGTSAATTAPTEPTSPVMLEELQALYQLNDHLVGWISIDDTRVNYPVVQTPNTPDWRDYYLYRNFQRENDRHGCLYVREACDVFAPSDNVTIYGHNMADFTMFGDLWQYGSPNFYKGHKYIRFDTLYERHTYEIFAVFRTSGTLGVGFSYHLFADAADQTAFDEFVSRCKELALYDTGITPTYGDKLITLSTCDFHLEDGRLVVVARRIS